MLNNFPLILYTFLILSLHFERLVFQSGIHEIHDSRLGLSLRQERIDVGVCEDESDDSVYPPNLEWDLCFKNDSSEVIGKATHCMCDNDCDVYQDCCVDNLSEEIISGTDLSCIELFSGSKSLAAIYGIDRCVQDWDETNEWPGIQDKCELNAFHFNTSGEDYSYLQDIAVMSDSTKIMYKNIFCAICNRDSSHLKTWNISVDCEGFQINDILKQQKNNMNPENYDPFSKKWKVFVNNTNESILCSLSVNQFKDKQFLDENFRKCQKTISECPQIWTNNSVDEKCQSYASYVFVDNKAYKNYHCALCNGVDFGFVSCFPNTSFGVFGDWSERTLWFPLLLDFNFGGDKGEWVGGQHKCPNTDQLYDPLYGKCVSIRCKGCVESDSSKHDFGSNCSAVLTLEEGIDFVILKNTSIYINKTESLLDERDYKVYTEGKGLKLKICRNESQLSNDSLIQSPFDMALSQIILSEVSLYTSIVCLALHLSVYALLPKLRNLPGKNLMSLSFALLLGHISFAIASYLDADRKIICVLIAITTHYSYLSAFFWMSVMAYDVCKTFGRTSRRSKTSKRYKFLKYSLYAWLTPAFIVLLSAAFDIGLKESKFQPLYGYRFCWISQRQALLVFFALPVAIIVFINILLFALTAKGLIKTEEQTKILNKKSDKVRYVLYVKLAIIMGLNWTFGFVASLTDWKFLWYPFIVLNGLQGAVIFIAFTCKPKVWKLLKDKFGINGGYERSATNSDVIRSGTGSTSLQTSTIVPISPNTRVTKINFPKQISI